MTPPPDKKKQRSLLLGLGCAISLFFVVLLVIGVAMYWMVRQPAATGRELVEGSRLPPQWRERVRAEREPPDEALRLAPPRSDSGNAAEVLYARGPVRGRNATVVRLVRNLPFSADDSAVLRQARSDSTLERGLRAARMRTFSVVPMLVSDTANDMRMFWARIPQPSTPLLRGAGTMADGLILRGWERARRGQRAAGAADLGAAIGIGLMMYEREPATFGAVRGVRVVEHAARLLGAVARDTATAGAALRVAAWAERRQRALRDAQLVLFVEPDSSLAAVTDTTLPFPVRAHALYWGGLQTMRKNPWRAFRGPTDALWRRAKAYEVHHDPDFAALGLALDTALTRIERVGRWRRARLFLRGL